MHFFYSVGWGLESAILMYIGSHFLIGGKNVGHFCMEGSNFGHFCIRGLKLKKYCIRRSQKCHFLYRGSRKCDFSIEGLKNAILLFCTGVTINAPLLYRGFPENDIFCTGGLKSPILVYRGLPIFIWNSPFGLTYYSIDNIK